MTSQSVENRNVSREPEAVSVTDIFFTTFWRLRWSVKVKTVKTLTSPPHTPHSLCLPQCCLGCWMEVWSTPGLQRQHWVKRGGRGKHFCDEVFVPFRFKARVYFQRIWGPLKAWYFCIYLACDRFWFLESHPVKSTLFSFCCANDQLYLTLLNLLTFVWFCFVSLGRMKKSGNWNLDTATWNPRIIR